MSGWRAQACKLVFALTFLALLGACSPVSRLEVRVILPPGKPKSTLYVTGVKACPPAAIAAPAPATTPGDAMQVVQGAESGWVDVTATFRGSRCSAILTVWFDSDGDGKPSSGDFVGSTPAIEIRDRGIFAGNLTVAPRLLLSPWP